MTAKKYVPYTASDGRRYNIHLAYNEESSVLVWENGYKACACCMSEETREAVLVALTQLPETVMTVTVQTPAYFGGTWADNQPANFAAKEILKKHGLERLVFISDTPSSLLPVYEELRK